MYVYAYICVCMFRYTMAVNCQYIKECLRMTSRMETRHEEYNFVIEVFSFSFFYFFVFVCSFRSCLIYYIVKTGKMVAFMLE